MSDLRCEYCRRNQPVKAVENDFCEHTGLTYEELVSQLSTYKEALMEIFCNTDGEIREIALQALTQSNPPKAEK